MIQRVVDNAIAVTKESVKTVTYESLNNIVRLINGISALLLAFLPGKASVLEGLHGWELRPTFRAPKFPRWMENGASSFNQIIYELSSDKEGSNVEYEDAYSDDDSCPSSPCLQSSRLSRAQSMPKQQRRSVWRWIAFVFYWIFFPVRFLLGLPGRLFRSSNDRSTRNSPGGNRFPQRGRPPLKKMQSLKLKDQVIQRTTDRRRGVIEDLHLAIEMVIEAVFDVVHKIAHFVLHPVYAIRTVFGLFSRARNRNKDTCDGVSKATVSTATLGDGDSAPSEATKRKNSFQELNTDARTCQDVITELGYPYEAIHVITDDGYVLLLERIPRRDSRKAVYLQHGVLDSSMGWVANGVVGSPAFAAYDQGYDVFLGNFRGLVSREHVDKSISSRKYWQYSINEHGTQDIPAMIEKIHQIKTAELKLSQPEIEEKANGGQPYKLCAVCHSLGGAGILMYVVTQRIKEKPHRLSRLILLSPAGFHEDSGRMFSLVANSVILLAPILQPLVPGIYIPTRFFRMLLNKLVRDFHNYPAIGGLVQTVMSYFVCGDSSNWVGVLGLPHYNMNDMPGVSFQVAIHLAQMKHARRFRMFDYGRASANMKVYGSPEPWDLGEHYGLIDIPVDLVAGRKDKIIRPTMVKKHYNTMRDAGVDASYNMFEYAHLDFTFSHREELLAYVMSRLLLVEPTMNQSNPKGLKMKKKGQQVNN